MMYNITVFNAQGDLRTLNSGIPLVLGLQLVEALDEADGHVVHLRGDVGVIGVRGFHLPRAHERG